jgi:hypothetical protein
VAHNHAMENLESSVKLEIHATPCVHGLIRPIRRWYKMSENVLMTIHAMDTRKNKRRNKR